jgi:hypothetical protein
LSLGADPAVGTSVTGRARWQNLLELLQELALAGGEIGFRMQHTGAALEFQAYQPADKSTSIRFSHDLGNLASAGYTTELPTTDHVYVGGQGEGTARTIVEVQDPTAVVTHGRFETFQDRRDTADTAELQQAGQEKLDEDKAEAGLSFTPVDSPAQEYRTDYDLGDRVTAYLDEVEVVELIREVTITIDEDGTRVEPTIGTPGAGSLLRIFAALAEQNRRLSHVERR